jgi:hypothetical protein
VPEIAFTSPPGQCGYYTSDMAQSGSTPLAFPFRALAGSLTTGGHDRVTNGMVSLKKKQEALRHLQRILDSQERHFYVSQQVLRTAHLEPCLFSRRTLLSTYIYMFFPSIAFAMHIQFS